MGLVTLAWTHPKTNTRSNKETSVPLMDDAPLVLASSSRFRQALLDRLQLPYQCYSPEIDETPYPNESPQALVHRLALSKANAVADRFPNHCIIGSDQIALFEGDILGKPHTSERACANLARFSGQRVTFLTGLALLDTRNQRHQVHIEPFDVVFRSLSQREIECYVALEQPLDSAGSFRMEGLGIAFLKDLRAVTQTRLLAYRL